jgi:hypothetical protein
MLLVFYAEYHRNNKTNLPFSSHISWFFNQNCALRSSINNFSLRYPPAASQKLLTAEYLIESELIPSID